tara:strand:+ start:827 stop:1120 length:294 start_codon:yes stop_codon:yes gene_type:complete
MPARKKTFAHDINGKTYRVKFTGALPDGEFGYCTNPHEKNPTILIADDLTGQEAVEVILHEFRHASNWWTGEEEVDAFSKSAAAFLFREDIKKRWQS